MRRKKTFVLFSVLAAVVLAVAGGVYQQTAAYYHRLSEVKVEPAIPFEQFPMQVGPWQGTPVAIAETVLQVAANDDYLSRAYADPDRRFNAMLYVAYTAEPRRMLGHRPRRCYTGSGWIHDTTEPYEIVTESGRQVPGLLHRFHRPGLDYQEVFVVNYYVLNGVPTADHESFSGLRYRRPKVTDGRAEYVAQVQVSARSKAAAQALAGELSDEIFRFLPETP